MNEDDDERFDALSGDDDAYVAALLADLPDVPMPDDVRARIDAALADLAAAPAPATAATVLPGGVIPISAARSRWRNPRILQAAAAVVLVVAAVAVGVHSLSSKSTPTSADASGAGAAATSAAAVASGTAYTTDSLAADIRRLVVGTEHGTLAVGGLTGAKSGATPVPQAATPTRTAGGGTDGAIISQPPAAAPSEAFALASNVNALAACINVIEEGTTYTQPIAIDAASYNGQSALLVVLPDPDDATSYGVWIVAPSCGQDGDAHVLTYAVVSRT